MTHCRRRRRSARPSVNRPVLHSDHTYSQIWISVLLSAGIDVEVCQVLEVHGHSPHKGAKRRKLDPRTNGRGRDKTEDDYGDPDADPAADEADEDDNEVKYESGDEGRGEGRLLSAAASRAVKAEAEAEARTRSEERENVAPSTEVKPCIQVKVAAKRKRARATPLGRPRGVLGDSACQPIEIN